MWPQGGGMPNVTGHNVYGGVVSSTSQQSDTNMVPAVEYNRLIERFGQQEEALDNLKFCILTIEAEAKLEADKEVRALKSDLNFKSQELLNLRREIDNLKRRQVANPTQALPPAPSFTQSSGSSGSITVAGGIGRLSSGGSDHGGGGGSGVHIAQRTFSEVNYGSSTVATTQQGYPLSLATPPTSQIQTVARISDYDSEWKEAQMLLRMTELSNQQDDFLYHLKQLLISQKTSNSASNETKRSKTEVSAAHTLDGLITSITAQLKMPHKLVLKNVADTVVDTCNYLITTRTSYQSALNHSSQQQQHKQDENIAISNPSVSVEAAISCVRFLVTIIESLSADDIEKIVSECEVTPLSSHLLSKFDAVAGESGSSQHNSSNSSHMATSVIASLSPPSNTSSSNSYTAKQSTSSSHVNVNSTSLPTVTVDDELMSQINNPFYHTKIRLNKDEHINISNIPSSRPAISGTATASATNTNRPSSLLLSHQLMNDPFLTKLFKLIRQLILYTRWCQNQSTKNNDGGDNNSNVININSLLQLRVEVGRLANSLFVGASGYRLLYNYNCATYILTVYSNSEISLFSDNCYGQFSEQNDKKNKGKNKGNHGYNTNTTISATKYGTSTTVNSHVSTTTTTAVDVANDMIIEYNDNITSDLILPKIPRLPPLLHLITTSHMFEYESDIKYEPDSNQSAIIVENLQIQSKLMEMLTVLLRDYRVFQLFVRSHIYESEEANDEDNEKENKLNKQGSTRNTHSFLQMLSKHLHQRLVPTSRNITNSIEINLQLSQFQLQICQFLRFFVCEYEATGLAVFLGLVLSDNDLASVAGIQHARLSSNKIPMTILSVSSHSSTPDPCLFRFCIQLWLDGARILDEAEHFEYIHNSNISGSDSIHTSTYMGMPSDMTKKQMLYSTISDILYELTQLLALVAERVSMADWTLITGEYKLLIHTQLRVWSSGKKHASLVRCSRYCSAIDLGGVDLADYDDD